MTFLTALVLRAAAQAIEQAFPGASDERFTRGDWWPKHAYHVLTWTANDLEADR